MHRLLFLLFFVSFSAQAWESTITCSLPTSRTDGSVLSAEEIQEVLFRVTYCDNTSEIFSATVCYIRQVTEKEPCGFEASIVDINDLQSDWQSAVIKTIIKIPNPPSEITAVSIER